jgi:hypothetical protein
MVDWKAIARAHGDDEDEQASGEEDEAHDDCRATATRSDDEHIVSTESRAGAGRCSEQ